MKLNPAQVERTQHQLAVETIPEDHPLIPQLNRLFGDHTYFLDSSGLSIVEPTEADQADGQVGVVVNLANWTDSDPPKLAAHQPELTDRTVTLGSDRDH